MPFEANLAHLMNHPKWIPCPVFLPSLSAVSNQSMHLVLGGFSPLEGRSLCVVQGSLEFWVLPPQPPVSWEHRSALSQLGATGILCYKVQKGEEEEK